MTARAYREYTLTCDWPKGCNAAFGPFGVERPRAALRKLAAREGWEHVHETGMPRSDDEDYCRLHAELRRRATQ